MDLTLKDKRLYVEVSDYGVVYVVAESVRDGIEVEAIEEAAWVQPQAVDALFAQLKPYKKGNYVHAVCASYPESRFIHRYSFSNVAKARNASFIEQVLMNDFQISFNRHKVALVDPRTGLETQDISALPKEVLFCGAKIDAIQKAQESLLRNKVYPTFMNIGTLSSLGILMDYIQFRKQTRPTALIEVGPRETYLLVFQGEVLEFSRKLNIGLESIYPPIQKQLGMETADEVRQLLFSNTFDFSEMGADLLRGILKEMESATGFYEAQTGQSIDQTYFSLLPDSLSWIGEVIAARMGLSVLLPQYVPWLKSKGIQFKSTVSLNRLKPRWLTVLGLIET